MSNTNLSDNQAEALNNSSPALQNALAGSKLQSALRMYIDVGTKYYLDPANGSDDKDGLSLENAVQSLPVAYAKLTANKNDILYIIGNNSSISLTAAVTWAKNYTHCIGVCAPVGISNRTRIFQNASASGLSPLFNITATGCVFQNIMIQQGVADATSKVAVQITGNRNYFENCHFAGIGNNTMDVDGAASLKLDAAMENRFVNCAIGLDTINAGSAATNTEIWFDSESSKNIFDNCLIYRRIEHETNHPLILVEDALGIGAFTMFRNCQFLYTSVNMAYTGTTIFSIPAISSKTRVIILVNCVAIAGDTSATDWDSNNRGILYNNTPAPASSAAGGLATNQ